jgi:hypothetical protein
MDQRHHDQKPSEDEIARCAYLIWEYEGRPENMDKTCWAEAEIQLIICYAHDLWLLEHRSSKNDRLLAV